MFSLDGGVRGVVICVYIAALGAAAFLLELGATAGAQRSASRAREVARKWRRQLEEWLKVFSRLWGRGLLYVFVGTLMASQDSLISLLVGLLDNAVGVGAVVVSRSTSSKLERLLLKLRRGDDTTAPSVEVVRAVFSSYDMHGDGSIDASELGALAASLGSPLKRNELRAALDALDADRSGTVSFEEFHAWFAGSADGGLESRV